MKDNKNYERKKKERPVFPKRAIITAGMPYGNKELHFGHVGGMFVHADTFARFLRDRIGEDNVIFVSGTDCYGSPISESYRKLKESGEDVGTITDYVRKNHELQKETLDSYEISLNLYAASALNRAGEIHQELSNEIFEELYEKGYLKKLSSPQFYDPDFDVLLNGRQVIGRCPIDGCASDKGYADECALGHQYMPNELIDPKSTLSGKKPLLKDVTNWYFSLDESIDVLKDYVDYLRKNSNTRKYIIKTIDEFLKKPCIYVKKDQIDDLDEFSSLLPKHTLENEEKKSSYTFNFENLNDRDVAREIMNERGIRFRTGKTLVPFRLSGNIDWGLTVPVKEGLDNLTFWVWPESLWAPISFTKTYLEAQNKDSDSWKDWWFSEDSQVYQFIGEDNIYFYGIAEMGIFAALYKEDDDQKIDIEKLRLPHLIANRHVLFMNKKASSSSDVKPPMAKDLLQYYTAEQLRMHFLSLGLATKSGSFDPQVYLPEEEKNGVDDVLKEGNLLTNVFNRLVRSCFYTAQKYYDNKIPVGVVSEKILEESKEAILEYERHMYNHQFHSITYVLDSYIRNMNKYWVNNIKKAETDKDDELRKQILIDSFHAVKTAALLIHPIAPSGCEMIREYLNVGSKIWKWDYAFSTIYDIIDDMDNHELKFLEPRVDFFKKHESQFM
ncbi:MAG: class I tRNA ligase family protein [Clostridiales bacterium]|nr:class I tRNA ligase family protein [Clostridiales bacterium]